MKNSKSHWITFNILYDKVFNCGTDKFVSYKSLCSAIAKSAKRKYISTSTSVRSLTPVSIVMERDGTFFNLFFQHNVSYPPLNWMETELNGIVLNWIELNWIELNWIELNWIELSWESISIRNSLMAVNFDFLETF